MNVILKQKEIEAALKLYALQQGIQLAGKTVLISFTAGRKDTGISAELDISDKSDTVSFIDTLIEQQANAIVIPEIPEPPAPVVLPVVDRLKTAAEIEEIRQSVNTEGVPEKLEPVFMHDAMNAEEEAEEEVQEVAQEPAAVASAPVNIFSSPFAAPIPAPQPTVELVEEEEMPFDVDESYEEVVVAQPVKSVSLFG